MKWSRWIEQPRLMVLLALAFALVPAWLAVVMYRDARQKDERVYDTTTQVLGEQLQTSFERHTYFPREMQNRARNLDQAALRHGQMLPVFPWQEQLPHLIAMAYAEVVNGQIIVRWKSQEREPVIQLGDDLTKMPGVAAAVNVLPSIDPSWTMGCMVAQHRMIIMLALPGNRSGIATHGYIVAWVNLESMCQDAALPLIRDAVLAASPLDENTTLPAEARRVEISDRLAKWAAGIRRGEGFSRLYGRSPWMLICISAGLGAMPFLLVALAWMQAWQRSQLLNQKVRLIEANSQLTRFKAIADTTSDFFGMCEVDMTASYMNPAGRALLGFTPDEPVETMDFNAIYSPQAQQTFAGGALAHAMTIGPWSGEITMVHRDGHEIPVSFVGFVVKSADGRPLHLGCIARDISARHQLDAQMRETLEQQRELVRLKSQFVSTVSHEFRTPLGVILSGADLLESYEQQLTPERRSELLTEIKDNTQHMTEMLESVLLLGRIESSRLVCEPKPVNVAALCRDIAHKVSAAAPTYGEITTNAPYDEALLDASLLGTILGNLLSNAVKYSPPGKPVRLDAAIENDHIVFRVSDQGIGIPADDMPCVFEPFHRSGNVGDVPGSGLGLAITQRCAELHRGALTIESVEGKGTTATVTIPIS